MNETLQLSPSPAFGVARKKFSVSIAPNTMPGNSPSNTSFAVMVRPMYCNEGLTWQMVELSKVPVDGSGFFAPIK